MICKAVSLNWIRGFKVGSDCKEGWKYPLFYMLMILLFSVGRSMAGKKF